MPCDTQAQSGQTLSQRKAQVLEAVLALNGMLARGLVKVKIGPQGAVMFEGWQPTDRAGVTDACAYRRLMSIGSSLAKAAIARAEAMAGRPVSKRALAAGMHSHDGHNWTTHKH